MSVFGQLKGRIEYRCSFCGRPQEQVRRMIAGPNRVYICDECVALCSDIIAREIAKDTRTAPEPAAGGGPARWSEDDEPAIDRLREELDQLRAEFDAHVRGT